MSYRSDFTSAFVCFMSPACAPNPRKLSQIKFSTFSRLETPGHLGRENCGTASSNYLGPFSAKSVDTDQGTFDGVLWPSFSKHLYDSKESGSAVVRMGVAQNQGRQDTDPDIPLRIPICT